MRHAVIACISSLILILALNLVPSSAQAQTLQGVRPLEFGNDKTEISIFLDGNVKAAAQSDAALT